MAKVYIVGLGPGNIDDLTLGAVNRIHNEDENFLRTEKHPTVSYFREKNITYTSFDYIYEDKDEFKDVYETIADVLIEKVSNGKDINYFVPGNPLVAEKTVEILIQRNIDIEIIGGMSFIDPLILSVERDPIEGLKIVDGDVFKFSMIDINTDMIIAQTHNMRILSEIKLILSEVYGDEYKIYVIDSAGIKGQEQVNNIPIYLLDRYEDAGPLTSIYVPRIGKSNKKTFDFNDILDIMKKLRGEDGCLWDMKQTHKSIRKCMIEEAYEAVDAIDADDIDSLIEELGDVLLQVVFHAEIAFDDGEFNIVDITTSLAEKLIYRHPHIFLDEEVVNSGEVVYNWDRLKDLQRGFKTIGQKLENISGLPSLMKGYKIQGVAAKIGFDWPNVNGVLEKIKEEYKEVLEEIESADINYDRLEDEIGDLLFSIVNLARFYSINPEIAMNRTNRKFIDRFKYMENTSKEQEKNLEDMTLQELDNLWKLSKKHKF